MGPAIPPVPCHIALDVAYAEGRAATGYVLFRDHRSERVERTGQVIHPHPEPYEPGAFYRRELPPLLAALQAVAEPLNNVFIDGHVWLRAGQKGLGYHLFEALGGRSPVIGIGKTAFRSAGPEVVPMWRSGSSRPLYVSAAGMDVGEAVRMVQEMAGPFRIPTLIKRADAVSRQAM